MACCVGIKHLAAEMAAFFLRAELVFEVHARRAGGDHRFHQFEDVERAAEAGFGVGDDRKIPMRAAAAVERFDLVEPRERFVEPFDDAGTLLTG